MVGCTQGNRESKRATKQSKKGMWGNRKESMESKKGMLGNRKGSVESETKKDRVLERKRCSGSG